MSILFLSPAFIHQLLSYCWLDDAKGERDGYLNFSHTLSASPLSVLIGPFPSSPRLPIFSEEVTDSSHDCLL